MLYIGDEREPGNPPPSYIDAELLRGEALVGHEPWSTLMGALNGAVHDVIFNHADGPAWERGAKADLGTMFWPLGIKVPDWEMALQLYQLYEHERDAGHELDLKADVAGSNELINHIVTNSGADPETVWTFFTNLDRLSRGTAAMAYVRPSVEKLMGSLPKPGLSLTTTLLIGAGLVVLGLHEWNRA